MEKELKCKDWVLARVNIPPYGTWYLGQFSNYLERKTFTNNSKVETTRYPVLVGGVIATEVHPYEDWMSVFLGTKYNYIDIMKHKPTSNGDTSKSSTT